MFKPAGEDEAEGENGIRDGDAVTLGGMLVEATRRFAKSGRELGIGRLEDLYGTVEIMLSPFKYNKYKNVFLKDALVTITGKVSVAGDRVSVWADTLTPWQSAEDATPKAKKLCIYFNFEQASPGIIDDITEILKAYPGGDEVYLKNTAADKLERFPLSAGVCDMLEGELYGLSDVQKIKIA